ncbi:MAG: homocysteine S-methyltransferase family protein [Flavobacteriales bacterium]
MLKELAKKKILILDGAMGTMIQRHGLTEDDFRNESLQNHPYDLKGNNDVLSITRPEIIRDIHLEYLNAGADIIETNTFSGTTIAQADYGLEHLVYDINYHGAQRAKEALYEYTRKHPDTPKFVAGAIGPTNKTASLSPDVNDPGFRAISFDQLRDAYYLQVEGLIDGGADILIVETIFDTLNAKAALIAINDYCEANNAKIPVMISGTITDASGRTLSGQTPLAFLTSLQHFKPFSIGFNCALGAEQLTPYLEVIAKHASMGVSAYPNAGLPNEMGAYDQSPNQMATEVTEYLKRGLVNVLGGCCGTTPEHIKAIAKAAANFSPRNTKVSYA